MKKHMLVMGVIVGLVGAQGFAATVPAKKPHPKKLAKRPPPNPAQLVKSRAKAGKLPAPGKVALSGAGTGAPELIYSGPPVFSGTLLRVTTNAIQVEAVATHETKTFNRAKQQMIDIVVGSRVKVSYDKETNNVLLLQAVNQKK